MYPVEHDFWASVSSSSGILLSIFCHALHLPIAQHMDTWFYQKKLNPEQSDCFTVRTDQWILSLNPTLGLPWELTSTWKVLTEDKHPLKWAPQSNPFVDKFARFTVIPCPTHLLHRIHNQFLQRCHSKCWIHEPHHLPTWKWAFGRAKPDSTLHLDVMEKSKGVTVQSEESVEKQHHIAKKHQKPMERIQYLWIFIRAKKWKKIGCPLLVFQSCPANLMKHLDATPNHQASLIEKR